MAFKKDPKSFYSFVFLLYCICDDDFLNQTPTWRALRTERCTCHHLQTTAGEGKCHLCRGLVLTLLPLSRIFGVRIRFLLPTCFLCRASLARPVFSVLLQTPAFLIKHKSEWMRGKGWWMGGVAGLLLFLLRCFKCENAVLTLLWLKVFDT